MSTDFTPSGYPMTKERRAREGDDRQQPTRTAHPPRHHLEDPPCCSTHPSDPATCPSATASFYLTAKPIETKTQIKKIIIKYQPRYI